MGEIEKAGMQREAVKCGVAAGKRVTCNPIKTIRENGCTAEYCKVLQGRTAKQNIKNKYKRYREEGGEEKVESTVWRWTDEKLWPPHFFSDPRGSTIEHREGKTYNMKHLIM